MSFSHTIHPMYAWISSNRSTVDDDQPHPGKRLSMTVKQATTVSLIPMWMHENIQGSIIRYHPPPTFRQGGWMLSIDNHSVIGHKTETMRKTSEDINNEIRQKWWTGRDLNARLLACKASDLPADLPAHWNPPISKIDINFSIHPKTIRIMHEQICSWKNCTIGCSMTTFLPIPTFARLYTRAYYITRG